MKPIFHLLSAISIFLLLSSCNWLSQNVPVVNDRDSAGRFITPVCPKDGQPPVVSGTVYVDASGHPFVAWHGPQPAATPKLRTTN